MNDKRALLWLAIEDYAGLWESVWQLRTLHPEYGDAELAHLAQAIVTRFFEDGLVRLYRCHEPYGELSPIEDSQTAGILLSDEHWLEPAAYAVSIRYSATDAGENIYALWAEEG